MVYTEVKIVASNESSQLKKMKLLTKKQQQLYKNVKICYIYKETFENKYLKDKKSCKVRDYYHFTEEYRGVALSICNLQYSVPKKNPKIFHNGSKYVIDYHKTASRLKKNLTCLGQKTENYLTFKLPTEKVIQELTGVEKKLLKINITYYNLLIAQGLWLIHRQFLSIIFLK